MRQTLLASATVFALACSLPALAQMAPPAGPTSQAPPADTLTPAPDATTQAAPAPVTPAKPKPHHMPVHKVADTGDTRGETWAHQPGTGLSGPASMKASNIGAEDSRSTIAPHLPQPSQGENASPEAYLRDAQQALAHHRTGLAQQALEMAETRLLDRSTAPEAANMPDQRPEITQVSQARNALGHGNVKAANAAIKMALSSAP